MTLNIISMSNDVCKFRNIRALVTNQQHDRFP
jgi:hypothetical protein